jgi:post-segregation antitoxin (ccd killing protein)
LLRRSPLIIGADTGGDVAALARTYFDRATIERLQARLTANSEWLWRAGDAQAAGSAARVAETLGSTSPAEHPFARGMVELGLRAVIEQLRRM